MPRTGRPPKPTERKRLAGNPGKRPLPPVVELVTRDHVTVPVVPKSLGDAGVATWRHLWSSAPWLSDDNVVVITLLCEAIDERSAYRQRILDDGPTVVGDKGALCAHPLIKEVRAIDKVLDGFLAVCGLTPSERARLSLGEVTRASKLDQLVARKAARTQ